MKKTAPILIALIILGGIAAFFVATKATAPTEPQAPEGAAGAEEQPIDGSASPSSEETTTGVPSPSAPPASGLGVQRVVTNDSWKIKLYFDPSWGASKQGETLIIRAPQVTFLVNEDTPIGEPEGTTVTEVPLTVAGKALTARRYEPSVEGYAYYEYFELVLGNDTYYFKVSAKAENDPDVAEFIAGIAIK